MAQDPRRPDHARFDVVIAIGRYAGRRLNEKPLTYAEAYTLAGNVCQRGRPEIQFNLQATLDTERGMLRMNTDPPLTHADLKPLLDRIAQLESALQARDRDIDQLEARVAALEQVQSAQPHF